MKIIGFILAVAAAFVAFYLLFAWMLMLVVGMVHWEWLHSLPTLGWHGAYVLALPLAVVLGGLTGTVTARSGS